MSKVQHIAIKQLYCHYHVSSLKTNCFDWTVLTMEVKMWIKTFVLTQMNIQLS